MKFYTPELLERFASTDEQTALAAQDELEQRSEHYAAYLQSIAKKLPPRFQELQQRFYLHDARVILPFGPWLPPWHPEMLWDMLNAMQLDRSRTPPSFLIALQLDAPPREFVVLHYRGVRLEGDPFRMRRYPRIPLLDWLHDEVELVLVGEQVEFQHSILFSEGVELRLQFTDFDFATLKPMSETNSPPDTRSRTAG